MTLHSAATLAFTVCAALIAWVYFGYPLALRLSLLGRSSLCGRAPITPSISVIVPAHNEELGIEAKLKNLLALDYPREQVEILVGSDGSSDRTQEIVGRFAGEGVGLVSFPQQQGKSAIQNGLVAVASGEILVFTDADCLLPAHSLRRIVENFADPRVGLVTAHPRYLNAMETPTAHNEGTYLQYETWLRRQESDRGLLAMASGSLFAVRRSLWRPLDRNLGDDFVLPLRIAQSGMRNVLDERVEVCTSLGQNQPAMMLGLKVRIISKDFRALLAQRALLNPFRRSTTAIALWSHKLLRWLVPYFLLTTLAANCFLLGSPFFRVSLFSQLAFYGIATLGFALRGLPHKFPLSVPMSFCVVNVAALLGTLKCIAGRTSGTWVPHRPSASTAASFEDDDLVAKLT
jgi:cellulose synthase/poly-beta-1,6-N-acetylglucosamine synthase-like glycosyltransferase